MGNEADGNERRKILTNKSSFNQINCREIQDSDSENEDNLKKGISKQSLSDSYEEEYEADAETNKSNEKVNNKEPDSNLVEYTFFWREGGNTVKLVGTFNNWKEQILMEKDPVENVFKYKLKLKRDKYEYKFIVDNVWKFSRQQGMKGDGKGNTNNFIDLTNYKLSKKNIGKNNEVKPVKKVKKIKKKKKEKKKSVDSFNVLLPQKEELNTEAPTTQELFLNSFYINEATHQKNVGEDKYYKYVDKESYTEEKSYRNLLYSPHVNLNHTLTYCDNKDILQVGLTYRFRNKDCTMVYYSKSQS